MTGGQGATKHRHAAKMCEAVIHPAPKLSSWWLVRGTDPCCPESCSYPPCGLVPIGLTDLKNCFGEGSFLQEQPGFPKGILG